MRNISRKILFPLIAALGLLITACSTEKEETEPIDSEGYRIYTIKAGEQECDNVYKNIKTTVMHFSVKFDSSAVYTTKLPENQYDINKLYGLADCNTAHHQNSARMGWCWLKNQLEIHAYSYKNGERSSKFITAIPIGKPADMTIEMRDTTYLFTVNKVSVELPRACNGLGEGYKLYPYFGGDEMAPHDIFVKVKDL